MCTPVACMHRNPNLCYLLWRPSNLKTHCHFNLAQYGPKVNLKIILLFTYLSFWIFGIFRSHIFIFSAFIHNPKGLIFFFFLITSRRCIIPQGMLGPLPSGSSQSSYCVAIFLCMDIAKLICRIIIFLCSEWWFYVLTCLYPLNEA